jgi:hypothetical protein
MSGSGFLPPRPPSAGAYSSSTGFDHLTIPTNSLEDSTYDFLSDAGRSDSSAQTESLASEFGDETSSNGYAFDSDLEDTEDEGDVVHQRRRMHTPEDDRAAGSEIGEVMVVGTETEDESDDEDERALLNSDLRTLSDPKLSVIHESEVDEKKPRRLLDILFEYTDSRKGEMFRLVFFLGILIVSAVATSNVIETGHSWWQTSRGEVPTTLLSSHLTQRNPAVIQVPKQAGTMEAVPNVRTAGRKESTEAGLGHLLASLDLISQQSKAILSNIKAASSSLSTSSATSVPSPTSAVSHQPLPISNGPNDLTKWAKAAWIPKKKAEPAILEKEASKKPKAEKKSESIQNKDELREGFRRTLPFPPPLLTLPDAQLAFARAQDRAVLVVDQVAAVAVRAEQAAERVACSVADKAEQAWGQVSELLRDTDQQQRIVSDSFDMLHGARGMAIEGAGEAVRMTAWAAGRVRAKWEEVSEFIGSKAEEMELERKMSEAREVAERYGEQGFKTVKDVAERYGEPGFKTVKEVAERYGEQGFNTARSMLADFMRDGRGVSKIVEQKTRKRLDKAQKRVKRLKSRLVGSKKAKKTCAKKQKPAVVPEDNGRRWTRYGFGWNEV